MSHVQQYRDAVRWAWESLNSTPFPDSITAWAGAPSPEAAQRAAVAKQVKVERNRKAMAAQRQYSEAERERRRVYAAAQYQKKKAARQAATLATHPSPVAAAQVAA